jgi:hypothetical protein
VAVAEARVDAQGDLPAGGVAVGGAAGQLVDHIGRAAVDVNAFAQAQHQGLGVEDVGRIDQWRRVAGGHVAGGQGAADFARADRIDQGPVAAEQFEHGQVRAGLLRIADVVEGGQVGQPLEHDGGIVDERGRAIALRQIGDCNGGNLAAEGGKHGSGRFVVGGGFFGW